MKNIFLLISVLVAYTLTAQTNDFKKVYCDKNESTITYSMNHPLHAWTGINNKVTSVILIRSDNETINQVAVIAKIAEFDSDNANRDSHTIEVTEALLYPNISFQSDTIYETNDSLFVSGNLTFHNISKRVKFNASEKLKKHKLFVDGGFVVKM